MKKHVKIFWSCLLVFCLFFSGSYILSNYAEAAVGSKWAYMIVDGKCGMGGVDKNETISIMNKYGSEGWEFAGFISTSCTFVMKKQIQ